MQADMDLRCRTCFEAMRPIFLLNSDILPLRKHAYSNILKILQPKKEEKKLIKNTDIFHISAKKIHRL